MSEELISSPVNRRTIQRMKEQQDPIEKTADTRMMNIGIGVIAILTEVDYDEIVDALVGTCFDDETAWMLKRYEEDRESNER